MGFIYDVCELISMKSTIMVTAVKMFFSTISIDIQKYFLNVSEKES